MIIPFANEVKVDLAVILHEGFKLIWGDGVSNSSWASTEITKEDWQFSQLENTSTAHLATI